MRKGDDANCQIISKMYVSINKYINEWSIICICNQILYPWPQLAGYSQVGVTYGQHWLSIVLTARCEANTWNNTDLLSVASSIQNILPWRSNRYIKITFYQIHSQIVICWTAVIFVKAQVNNSSRDPNYITGKHDLSLYVQNINEKLVIASNIVDRALANLKPIHCCEVYHYRVWTVTGQNVDKPKRRQPKRRQNEKSTKRKVDNPKRRQTKPSTTHNVDRPKRRHSSVIHCMPLYNRIFVFIIRGIYYIYTRTYK